MSRSRDRRGEGARIGRGLMRRSSAILLILIASMTGLASWAQEEMIPRWGISLSAELEVQRILLEEDLERYDRLTVKRADLATRLAALYKALDAAVQDEEGGSLDQIETHADQAGEVEAERAELLSRQRMLIARVRERQRTIGLIEEKLAAIPDRPLRPAGPLVGTWDVILMPAQQYGAFIFAQTGTLINGTYTLDGGWTGSLQGTLINRKIYMVRIDSKKGRMMELEGYLAADGMRIRGTWLSYELSGGSGATGQWSAEKQVSEN
jgi:hypothetical protein